MDKKKEKTKKIKSFSQKLNKLKIVEYEITTEALHDPEYENLPANIRQEIENIFYMVYENPGKAIRKVKKLIVTYPDIPQLYNYFIIAYSNIGEQKKAEALILENYKKHPGYLFAKLNYAEICMRKGNYEKVPEIFDHKFELNLLYPERKVFHISEVVNFSGTIGYYYVKTGNREAARVYYNILNQLAPKHKATQRLKELLTSPENPVN